MNTESPKFGKREEDVVRLLMQGKSNNQIAYELGISVRTVEYHLGKVYARLKVASRTEAILKLSKGELWESTNQNSDGLGESRVENIEEIGDDGESILSPRSIPVQNSTPPEKFNQFWAAAILILLLLIACLISAGLLLSARGLVQFPIGRDTVAVSPSATVEWGIDISQGPDIGLPRTLHTATRLNDGRVLLVGGSNGINEFYTLVDIFDPVSGGFTQAASLHTPRHDHSATLLQDGRVLVVGGYNAQQRWLGDAELYDPLANTWTIVAPIYSHGVQHTATLMADGRVLVVGGCVAGGICTNQVEIFDPQTNAWTEGAPSGSIAASHSAVLLDDGRVLIAGGTLEGSGALIYDPRADTWTATGPMLSQHAQASMVKLADGRVLIAGGINVSDTPIALGGTEIYDPATNAWKAAAALAQPRFGHLLALLPDGQVLAVGGAREYDYPDQPWTAESFTQAIECYDPRLDAWSIVAELPLPVVYADAVSLPDHRLWLTGGGASSSLAKAWANTWFITPSTSQP